MENRLHWVLDVTCYEDQARNRNGHCAGNLGRLESDRRYHQRAV